MSFDWNEFKSERATWDRVGQVLEGRLTEIGVFVNNKGERSPKLTIATADGRSVQMVAPTDLKSKLADLAPKIGDTIRIEFTGEKQVGQPSPMKVFRVGISSAPAGTPVPAATTTDSAGDAF